MIKNKWYSLKEVKDSILRGQYISIVLFDNPINCDLGSMDIKEVCACGFRKEIYRGYVDDVNCKSIWDINEEPCIRLIPNRPAVEGSLTKEEESQIQLLNLNSIINSPQAYCSYIMFEGGNDVVELKRYKVVYAKLVEKSVKKIKEKYRMNKIKAVQLETRRIKGETKFIFEVDPIITEFFKEVSKGSVKESTNWKGLSFYLCKSLQEDTYYKEKLSEHHLFDNYGLSLIDSGGKKMNIAWLRTVGGSGEIVVEDTIPLAFLATYTKDVIAFLKEYLEDTFSETRVVGNVSIEL